MPTMHVKPDVNGNVEIGNIELPVALITSLAAIEGLDGVTAKQVKLQDARIAFNAVPNGSTVPVEYTVAIVITRGAVTDAEKVRVENKEQLQDAAKEKRKLDTENERKMIIRQVQETERAATSTLVEMARENTRMIAQVLAPSKA